MKVTSSGQEVSNSELQVTGSESEDTKPATDNHVTPSAVEAQQPATDNPQPTTALKPETRNTEPATVKVSALSLASIRAKKELAEAQKSVVKETVHLPSEPFTETQMQEQWLKYAQRMEDKGYRIIASLLTINDPILDGTTIIHELPNESSKIDFEKERPELLGYLRGKLHNHDIQIVVKVNETLVVKRAFTNQDKYNRLVEINPNLEVLKKMFDLDV
ncbi:DNA polymerase III subunit gamma/tau [Flavobacterium sedimenticola]|uniref:DNA polymerase III subunit gamma/tau n=1 Tax=Flavobacterium sedimenticola TaxID=3043286 RepID=A0ABT6XPY4_9FLAO|nr:DNA polymerase III subunit gamma/tau [Flavobacterium sedimenticola]MDI9257047.1 DNA polymerase III subunit gamma/tau [Flavobacterium sedimenticola]